MLFLCKRAQDSAGFASVAPAKGGDAGKFFAAHRGRVPARLRHCPHQRGAMLSVLSAPLLGRCKTNLFFRRRAFVCGIEAALISELFGI